MIKNKDIEIELSSEQKDRLNKLKVIIDKFEETSLIYGPASSEELKNRINKIARNFDDEFKLLLSAKFDLFWAENKTANKADKNNNTISDLDIPKFLKNYRK
jgi:hypothetical protein